VKGSNVITGILTILTFEFQDVQNKLSGDEGPYRIMTHRFFHQLREIWQIKCGQKGETRLWHLVPSSLERLCLRNCSPSKVLASTVAMSGIVRPSSRMIHKRLVGHHSSRNVLMGVINIAPSQIGSGLGVSQSMKLTSFRCESGGYRWICHAKRVGRNHHRGGRGVGQNLRRSLSARLVVPPRSNRIRPGVKSRNASCIRSIFNSFEGFKNHQTKMEYKEM
jgi:hypothetical protein